jgi:hypothetical protein
MRLKYGRIEPNNNLIVSRKNNQIVTAVYWALG